MARRVRVTTWYARTAVKVLREGTSRPNAVARTIRALSAADVYGPSHDAIGHNERLIARALRRWRGDAPVVVATKGGLIRGAGPGRWRPKGTARHLREACERSLRALELDVLELYQLHAPDQEVPWRTSLRALEALKADGSGIARARHQSTMPS